MRKNRLPLLLALVLLLPMLAACDAPGVVLLESLLPPLTEKATGYTVTESIEVTETATGKTVSFSTPAEMNTFHQQVEGIKCVRESAKGTFDTPYEISFRTADKAAVLSVAVTPGIREDKSTRFFIDGKRYDAVVGGVDLFYLAGLFKD